MLFYRKLLSVAVLTAIMGLTACGSDNNPASAVVTNQFYLGETPFNLNQGDNKIVNASNITVMTYNMPGVNDKTVKATALLITPNTPKPKDGWRVVVWAHGTLGVGDSCAQSNTTFSNNRFTSMADKLLAEGYMIVAPDYEGLGSPGIHPYLNLGSEAKSAIYAVNAVKEQYKTDIQGNWMSVGQSQGGHAVLGISEYAAADVNYKGSVAGAPASSLDYIILEVAPKALAQLQQAEIAKQVPAGSARSAYADLLALTSLTAVSVKASQPNFNYLSIYSERAGRIAQNAEGTTGDNGLCFPDLTAKFSADIQSYLDANPGKTAVDYPGLNQQVFVNDPTLQEFLRKNQPATKKLNTPTLIIQGQADLIVPFQVTQALQQNLKNLGSDVTFLPVAGASHTQAIVDKQPELVAFIKKNMPAK